MRTASSYHESVDLSSRGNVTLCEPDRYRDVLALPGDRKYSAEGGCLSLPAAGFSFHSTVVSMRRFNRILAWDAASGVLEAESGITLGEIFDFLLARGFWMPVTPGYPKITLGGCIAGNVHGKNQYRDATFSRHVLGLTLFHPDHGVMTVGPEQDPGLFELTLGGYGLTGFILSARVRTARLKGNAATVRHVPVGNLSETFAVLGEHERVGSTDKHMITFHNSGHVLTVDSEREQVAEVTYQFIQKHIAATLKNDQKREIV